MSELVGKTLGPYQVLRKIRSTHTNTIYKANHQQLGRFVTLQVVLPDTPHPENLVPRLKEFSRILSRLSHPNIGTLLDCEIYDGQICLAYDFVPHNVLRRRFNIKMHWEDAARSLVPVAQALTYAHQQGVIHGHIRPESILINSEGGAVLFDFGLELLVIQEIVSESVGNWLGSDGSCYAPPEQTMGKKLDARSDIYSLGMVLYELVTGQRAYQGERSIDEIIQQISTPLPNPSNHAPNLPKIAKTLLYRSLAIDPADRFQSIDHMATLLTRAALHQPLHTKMLLDPNWKPRSLPKHSFFLGIGVCFSIALLAFALFQAQSKLPFLPPIDATENIALPSESASGNLMPSLVPEAVVTKKATKVPQDGPIQVVQTATVIDDDPVIVANPVNITDTRFPLLAGITIPSSHIEYLEPENSNQIINLSQIGIGWLNDIAWDPKHNRLAAATTTGVYLLNSPDYTLSGYINTSGTVLCAAFSPDGSELATGDADGLVRIWNLDTGKEKFTLSGHLLAVRRVIYSPKGNRLVSVSDDKMAWLWDPNTGMGVMRLDQHVQAVTGAAFTSDEQTLVTVSSDYNIILWDANTGDHKRTIIGRSPILDAAFSPDGKFLYTTGNNRAIEAWDTNAEATSTLLGGTETAINEIEVSPDGELLAVAETSGKVTVFNKNGEKIWASTNKNLSRSNIPAKNYANRIAFTADSSTLISGIWDNTIRFWQAQTGQDIGIVSHFSDFIKRLAVSPSNTYLAGLINGGGVKIWKLSNGQLITAKPLPGELMDGKAFSDDERLIVTKIDANTVAVYQVSNGKEIYRFTDHAAIRSIAFSNDGAFLAAGDASGMKIWSLSSGQELITSANYGMGGCTIVSPKNGTPLAIANRDHYIGFLNDINSDICVITRTGWMKTLTYRVDTAPYLAATGGASRLEVWNYANSQKREQEGITAMSGLFGVQVEVVALAPVADLVAGALDDYSIGIWRASTVEDEKIRLEGHLAPITALVFTPNGKFLISSSMDGTIRIWGIDPGE